MSNLYLENQLCFSLYSATHALLRSYKPDLDKLNLTYPQYLVLVALWQFKQLSINDQIITRNGTTKTDLNSIGNGIRLLFLNDWLSSDIRREINRDRMAPHNRPQTGIDQRISLG